MTQAVLRPSFIGAARGEVIKVSRQWAVWAMLGVAVVLLAVVALATSGTENLKLEIQRLPNAVLYDVMDIYGTTFQIGSGIFMLVTASRLFGMEYSGTVRVIYARGTGRLQLLLAKTAVLALIGVALLAGYVLLAGGLILLTVQADGGNAVLWVQGLPGAEWQDAGRWLAVQGLSLSICILIAAAAAGIGRSLAFAMPAALVLFPVDNFLVIILQLASRATRQDHPWRDVSTFLLGPNLNQVLTLWEPGHHARVAFASPLQTVSLQHVLAVVAAYAAVLGVLAVVRTVRPDVLE